MIVYRLTEPFEEYMYDRITTQWFESGRAHDNIDWIEDVSQISDTEIEVIDENRSARIVKIDI